MTAPNRSSAALKLTLTLTPEQAKLAWLVIDGALDAGACADGLSEEEREACWIVATALSRHSSKVRP